MASMLHDGFVKAMMSHPQVAKDFFEAHLPLIVQEQLNLNTLNLENIMTLEEAIEARGEARGFALGEAKGIALGEIQGIDHTLRAIELLKAGSTLDAIGKVTGLSETVLIKLQQSILN